MTIMPTPTSTPNLSSQPTHKIRELASCTVKSPPFAYIHLTSLTTAPHLPPPGTAELDITPSASLDALQVRAYCTSALRQFLGDTGAAIAVDLLALRGADCWVRVPRPDLGAFAAAITAYSGVAREGEGVMILQLRACGDWLGSLLGKAEESELWAP
ncbi:hypothetical protein B0T25DRAFT_93001 [Lasiosphaeria hispida]|uniref:Ribonucleases P/MRP subunit Pop8-like domain-containing protein n=1 Tax=Lasiosphaeria hispida TaxID=260671 RepID=A0AAJ0HPX0_9PEZI|nr:hypothetical protein B0T25DRAFT_93001 [Lasiosphaeria hispida]